MTKIPITEERRKNGLRPFGADVRPLIAPVLGKTGFLQADVLSRWTEIVGSVLAQGVYPAAIRFSKNKDEGAVLQVKTVSGAFATEVSARTPEILERLNFYFGYNAFSAVRIVQGAPDVPRRKTDPKDFPVSEEKRREAERLTEKIEDEELRQALIELGTYAGLKK